MNEPDDEPGRAPDRKPLGAWGILLRVTLVLAGGFVLFVLLILGTCFLS